MADTAHTETGDHPINETEAKRKAEISEKYPRKKHRGEKKPAIEPPVGFAEYLEDFRKKFVDLCPLSHGHLNYEIIHSAATEWKMMPEYEKAPFISTAEDKLWKLNLERNMMEYYQSEYVSEDDDTRGADGGRVPIT
ncbi:hypothetical protein LguiB_002525 [Lonicera macranthoides]